MNCMGIFTTPIYVILQLTAYIPIWYKPYFSWHKQTFQTKKSIGYKFLKSPAVPASCFPVWRKEFFSSNFIRTDSKNFFCSVRWQFWCTTSVKTLCFCIFFLSSTDLSFTICTLLHMLFLYISLLMLDSSNFQSTLIPRCIFCVSTALLTDE